MATNFSGLHEKHLTEKRVSNPSIVLVAGKRWCGSQAGGRLFAALFRGFWSGRVCTFRLPCCGIITPNPAINRIIQAALLPSGYFER
jgi:hypothetical protein